MKKMICLIGGSLLLLQVAFAQSQTEKINKSGSFSPTQKVGVLSVANIQGLVKIEGYNGNKVLLTGEKTITAKNQLEVAKGMQETKLELKEAGDSIYVYIDAPFIFRKKSKGRSMHIDLEDVNYEYKFDLTLKVPFNTHLLVSTVNAGDVTVNDMRGEINARNVNGGIFLNNISGKTSATTVNGPVEVRFTKNPTAESTFKTINGPIKVFYAPQLNATISFKSMNGQFYTDLSELELLPVKVTRNPTNNGTNTVYKIDKKQSYKAGQGGIPLIFETLNGDIYLKKK